MPRKKQITFVEKLEVVLLHGSIRNATDTEIAAITDIHIDCGLPAYCFENYTEMMIGDGENIIQFNKIKPFIEYVYEKVIADSITNLL